MFGLRPFYGFYYSGIFSPSTGAKISRRKKSPRRRPKRLQIFTVSESTDGGTFVNEIRPVMIRFPFVQFATELKRLNKQLVDAGAGGRLMTSVTYFNEWAKLGSQGSSDNALVLGSDPQESQEDRAKRRVIGGQVFGCDVIDLCRLLIEYAESWQGEPISANALSAAQTVLEWLSSAYDEFIIECVRQVARVAPQKEQKKGKSLERSLTAKLNHKRLAEASKYVKTNGKSLKEPNLCYRRAPLERDQVLALIQRAESLSA